jgi:hypothetical protein
MRFVVGAVFGILTLGLAIGVAAQGTLREEAWAAGAVPVSVSVKESAYAYTAAIGYTEFGPVVFREEIFDARGRLSSWTLSYGPGTLAEKGQRAYAADGSYTEKVEDGQGKARRTMAYSAAEKALAATAADGRSIYRMEILEAGKSRSTGSLRFEDPSESYFYVVETFDPLGRLERSDRFTAQGSLAYSSGYRYGAIDARGNWTEREKWEIYGEAWERPRAIEYRILAYAEAEK